MDSVLTGSQGTQGTSGELQGTLWDSRDLRGPRGLFYSWGLFLFKLFFGGDLRGLAGTLSPRGPHGTQLRDFFVGLCLRDLRGLQRTLGDLSELRRPQGTSGDSY